MFRIFDKLSATRFAHIFLFAGVDAAIFYDLFTPASWTFHPFILPHLSLLVVVYQFFFFTTTYGGLPPHPTDITAMIELFEQAPHSGFTHRPPIALELSQNPPVAVEGPSEQNLFDGLNQQLII